jgi:hypothetical protein
MGTGKQDDRARGRQHSAELFGLTSWKKVSEHVAVKLLNVKKKSLSFPVIA